MPTHELSSSLKAFVSPASTLPKTGLLPSPADLSKVTGPHSDVPLRVVGAGRAEEGLRADWQEQLATVEREIGFHYLRMLCIES